MKKHSILKIILLSILVVVICTWLFPTANFKYELLIGERNQVGIFDISTYISQTLLVYFSNILLMVLATGIFYGVAHKIPAYRDLLDKIVQKFSGKENIFLIATMILLSVIVSVTGLSMGVLFVFPFIISVIMLMGYNKLVAASVTIGSIMVGILGTTLDTTVISTINSALGITANSEILAKVFLLIIGLILLIYNVIHYAMKTKNNTDKVVELVPSDKNNKVEVIKTDTNKIEVKTTTEKKIKTSTSKKTTSSKKTDLKNKEANTKTKSTKKKTTTKTKAYDLKTKVEVKVDTKPKKKRPIWPFILVFDLVFIIIIASMFDWKTILNITWFEDATEVLKEFTIKDFPIFSKIFGAETLLPFGQWTLGYEIPMLIVLATCYLGFIYKLKLDDFFDGVITGVKKALKPAIYMLLINLVVIIVTFHPFQLNFTKFILDFTSGFNIITMTLTAMVGSLFNVESVYLASNTLPYVASVVTDQSTYSLIGIIYQAIYGVTMLVAPTSVILLGTLTYLDVSYSQWLKHIWKLFLELLLAVVVIFLIVFSIPKSNPEGVVKDFLNAAKSGNTSEIIKYSDFNEDYYTYNNETKLAIAESLSTSIKNEDMNFTILSTNYSSNNKALVVVKAVSGDTTESITLTVNKVNGKWLVDIFSIGNNNQSQGAE